MTMPFVTDIVCTCVEVFVSYAVGDGTITFCPFVPVSDIYCFLAAGKILTYIVTIRELAGEDDEIGWHLQ
jgi:hypothetical protein